MKGLKVISLFDGMAGGMQALKMANIPVSEYHAFEIDPYAIKVAKHNHPGIIHHGSVVDFDFTQFKDVDLLIGGSPCTGFSRAGKGLNFDDPQSKLFFDFVRAKEEMKPKRFSDCKKFYTLTAQDKHGVLIEGYIRKLTPIECLRLQSFTDNCLDVDGISNAQKYRMTGNGWNIEVITHNLNEMKLNKPPAAFQLSMEI